MSEAEELRLLRMGYDAQRRMLAKLEAQRDELLEACKTFHEWVRREEEGFAKAGRDRSTPEGEAAWREWYDENVRLCSLAQEQASAAIAKATGEVTR